MAGIDILSEASAISLILLIREKGEIHSSDLRRAKGGYDRLKSVASRMKEIGLISIETIEKPYFQVNYRLTEKGIRVVEKLDEIDAIISE